MTLKDAHQNSDVDKRKLAECAAKIDELNLKVQVLTDDSRKVSRLQAQMTSWDVE